MNAIFIGEIRYLYRVANIRAGKGHKSVLPKRNLENHIISFQINQNLNIYAN